MGAPTSLTGSRTSVMTPWPAEPDRVAASNRETVERLAGIPVSALPRTSPERLVGAALALPLDDWL